MIYEIVVNESFQDRQAALALLAQQFPENHFYSRDWDVPRIARDLENPRSLFIGAMALMYSGAEMRNGTRRTISLETPNGPWSVVISREEGQPVGFTKAALDRRVRRALRKMTDLEKKEAASRLAESLPFHIVTAITEKNVRFGQMEAERSGLQNGIQLGALRIAQAFPNDALAGVDFMIPMITIDASTGIPNMWNVLVQPSCDMEVGRPYDLEMMECAPCPMG